MSKVALYIMTEKGFEVLRRALASHPQVIAYVVVGEDPALEKDFAQDIFELAKSHGVTAYLRKDAPMLSDMLYVMAVSWRWMIDHPSERLIVFHDSLLPRYRGFAPLVNMLINGEKEIGVTALFGAQGYDEGDIISARSTPISYPLTIAEAIALNIVNYCDLVEEVLGKIANGMSLQGQPQDTDKVSYSIWRDAEDYKIDWAQSAETIKRFVDAVGMPYAGAVTQTSDGVAVRVLAVEIEEDVHCELRHVGKVIFVKDGFPVVICGQGLLRLTKANVIKNPTTEPEMSFLPLKRFREKFV